MPKEVFGQPRTIPSPCRHGSAFPARTIPSGVALVAFSVNLLWLINGVAFYVLLFSTDQWRRLVPLT